MAQIITTGSEPRLLLEGIGILFGDNYAQLDEKHSMIYRNKKSRKHFEEAVQLVGMGMAEKKAEGSPISLAGIKQGYTRRTYHNVWSKGAKITMEAFQDNLYLDQANEIARNLARALWHAKEFNAALLFNNATSTSAPYVGADGKALLADDHPLGGGGTLDNLVASDLSELALENACIQMAGWTDNADLLIDAKAKCLVIPKDSVFEAHRILKSELRVGTPDNDANALRDMGLIPKILPWNFLTDTDSWYILTDQDGLCSYTRDKPESAYAQDDLTRDHIYMMTERYSFDHYDPRAIIGSMGV